MNRRVFISSVGAAFAHSAFALTLAPGVREVAPGAASPVADHTLRIEDCQLELAPGITVRTVGYNGQVPGPLLRLREGITVTIDVANTSANPDLVHWHGLAIDSLNDGAMEEGSSMIPPGGRLRYRFTPRPSGTRWYHTHAGAGSNLSLGTYSGQFGF
jgi:FtsP/CotA-like multicopper oxidase with cupredoxin domain